MRAEIQRNYNSTKPDHLNVSEGEIVSVFEDHPNGFYKVGNSMNNQGWVPKNLITLGTPFTPLGDYQPADSTSDEVPLVTGKTAYGFQLDGEWWRGENFEGGQVGYFPSTWVEQKPMPPIPISRARNPDSILRGQNLNIPGLVKTPPIPSQQYEVKSDNTLEKQPLNIQGPPAVPYNQKPMMDINRPFSMKVVRNGQTVYQMPLQYALWAHNMGLWCALLSTALGFFAILWTQGQQYQCEVDGNLVDNSFTQPNVGAGSCTDPDVCCYESKWTNDTVDLGGGVVIGVIFMLLGPIYLLFENTSFGYGKYFPEDAWWQQKFPFHAAFYFFTGVIGFGTWPTFTASVLTTSTAVTYYMAWKNFETGDGGRKKRAERKAQGKTDAKKKNIIQRYGFLQIITNPIGYYRRIKEEDLLSVHIWGLIYFFSVIAIFSHTWYIWEKAVQEQEDGLEDGTLNVTCDTDKCKDNINVVKYGPLSHWGPLAKACGNTLNFLCTLILIPVTRLIVGKINDVGISFTRNKQNSSSYFARFFAHPITRYIPLSKNIAFHKRIAKDVFIFSLGHTIAHFFNFWASSDYTIARFGAWGWRGTDLFSGAVILWAMFFIYTAATKEVRHASFEIFFYAHNLFTIFFFFLYLHGPVYYLWATVPILLYMYERFSQVNRGNAVYFVTECEWIEPVLQLKFVPGNKDDLRFKEGQYLYLNCPFIAETEWHPFTISSATGDLDYGPRVALETGEKVYEVPRPKNLPSNEKWAKYCPVSKDYKTMQSYELLDKHETTFHDYISLHIKILGLDSPVATTWTRKLKEYIELMNPNDPFPYYFTHRDQRGELQIGRQKGPNGKQILRVDGPHAAPSEHYTNYGTVMVVGAGIGLTPCASILTAMLKYRWKKNFRPEILHFYWLVRWSDIESYQWLINLLAELEYELKYAREQNQVSADRYAEINIFMTGKKPSNPRPLYKTNTFSNALSTPSFTADDLYAKIYSEAPVDSKQMISTIYNGNNQDNRLQDIWLWRGRPDWDQIFAKNAQSRQHRDIGVCFCGAPVIGKSLKSMCRKYSSEAEDVIFSLHKEVF